MIACERGSALEHHLDDLRCLRDRYRAGVLFALYLVLAGVERFLVEFVRRDQPVAAGLTAAQIESLVLIAVGAAAFGLLRLRGSLRATFRRLDRANERVEVERPDYELIGRTPALRCDG